MMGGTKRKRQDQGLSGKGGKRKPSADMAKRFEFIKQQFQMEQEVKSHLQQAKERALVLERLTSKVSKDMRTTLMHLTFSPAVVDAFHNLVKSIPVVWPDNIRLQLIKEEWSGKESVDHLWTWYNQSSLTCSDVPEHNYLYIGPPTGDCFLCTKPLQTHNPPVQIRYVTTNGTTHKKKVSLRCTRCDINYNYDRYGNKKNGTRFYDQRRPAVAATDCVLLHRQVFTLQWAFAQHAWVSFEGFAESWEEAFPSTDDDEQIDRRTWASGFWWGELEEELHRVGRIDYLFIKDADREKCMAEMDELRSQGLYPHPPEDCSDSCKKRGCGKLWDMDGLWKNQFAHCQYKMKSTVTGMPLLNFPLTCTNEPVPFQAFCKYHCDRAKMLKIPTNSRKFVRYVRNQVTGNYSRDNDQDENEYLQYESVGQEVYRGTTVIQEQGGQNFITGHEKAVVSIASDCTLEDESRCNKDLGERKTVQKKSRGHMFVVRAGGHIDMWTPLYQSESLGQVFLFTISWLYLVVKDMPEDKWGDIILAYDNMCQLLKLKASSHPLPLPAPYDQMWNKIHKVIDSLHIKNHKDENCHQNLHPSKIGEVHPDLKDTKNTQAAEQTFVWLGRYKKITSSMPKVRHLFYMHRLTVRRNQYIGRCNRTGKRPLLPSVKNKTSTQKPKSKAETSKRKIRSKPRTKRSK